MQESLGLLLFESSQSNEREFQLYSISRVQCSQSSFLCQLRTVFFEVLFP